MIRSFLLISFLLVSCQAPISETASDWQELSLADFINVNGTADTWSERDGVIVCSGQPLGGAQSRFEVTNFEMEFEWRHLDYAGNAGLFLWCPESAFTDLPPGQLPRSGIEVQILDLGYEEEFLKSQAKRTDWFTSHGDIFPVGASTMTAVTPEITYTYADGTSSRVGRPDSPRSYPTKRISNPAGEWNHYRILAVDGRVTLWLNGVEINGGYDCHPATGYLALESEGAVVEYRKMRFRLRRLP